jgi:phosphatidylglycerophosphatase C
MPLAPDPEQPPRPGRTVAAFDFDGTLTTLDTLRDFVKFAVGPGRYAAGLVRAAPWFLGALTRCCGRGPAKARFLAVTLGGRSRSELEAVARDYVEQRLPALVRPEMAARVQEHRQLGHELVLVSASPSLYLELWAAQAGFAAVLATELEFRDGTCSGRLAGPNCWGPEKVRRLRQWFAGERPGVLYAYGDSRGDRELLAMADHAWLRGDGALPPLTASGPEDGSNPPVCPKMEA